MPSNTGHRLRAGHHLPTVTSFSQNNDSIPPNYDSVLPTVWMKWFPQKENRTLFPKYHLMSKKNKNERVYIN